MDQFNIEDFTEKHYETILKKLIEKEYRFINYSQIKDMKNDKNVLMRHDVDFSPHRGLKLSSIEKQYYSQATYFIMISSEFYNIFEKEIKKILLQIIANGHSIGLHFDPSIYEINNQNDLVYWLNYEKDILEKLLQIKVDVFSFHNPTSEIMKYDELKYSDMVNTYSTYLKDNFSYCSDSNGYWRHTRMFDFIENTNDNIQLLTHPEWWQKNEMIPRERVKRAIYGRAENNLKMYDNLLKAHGRINVGK